MSTITCQIETDCIANFGNGTSLFIVDQFAQDADDENINHGIWAGDNEDAVYEAIAAEEVENDPEVWATVEEWKEDFPKGRRFAFQFIGTIG